MKSAPPFQATPDFKGIKTLPHLLSSYSTRFQATPDFKGIKTLRRCRLSRSGIRFRPPLISKGLRLVTEEVFVPVVRFRPPLISKGLRRYFAETTDQARGFRPPLISKGLNPAAAAALAAGLGKCCVNEEKAVSGFRCQCFGFGRKLFAGNLGL